MLTKKEKKIVVFKRKENKSSFFFYGGVMAISKIKAIKNTLKKAIDYITDPNKTEKGTLVSTYGCSMYTADVEMSMTAQKGGKSGNRIAYHLMQSFAPEDNLTPEDAHRIGMEFAQNVLGGKYEFVIATHTDKDHLHNHIIFNATDYIHYKKYHINFWEHKRIRRENDKLCHENGLSVIEETSGVRGKSRYEYEQSKKGESWKDKLKIAIDEAISKSNNFDEFIQFMELEGYEIKRGKHISFRAPDQNRFTRAKRIGDFYTEEMIQNRIQNKEFYASKSKKKTTSKEERPKQNKGYVRNKNNVNLIVDISKCLKAKDSVAYKRAVVRGNINSLAETMSYLQKNNLKTTEQLEDKINEVSKTFRNNNNSIKDMKKEMQKLSEKIKFTQNYFNYGKIAREAKSMLPGSTFLKEHEQEIILYHAAEFYMKRENVNVKELNLKGMFDEYKQTKMKHDMLSKENTFIKNMLKELKIVQQNIEATLDIKLAVENNEKSKKKEEKNKDILL